MSSYRRSRVDCPAPPALAPVLLDTDVFSKVLIPAQRDAVGKAWASVLTGRTVVIAVPTAVELRAWPRLRGWGEKKASDLEARVGSVTLIAVNDRVQAAFVDLTVWARKAAHGISPRSFGGPMDRRVGHGLRTRTAAIDGIYAGIGDLKRLTL